MTMRTSTLHDHMATGAGTNEVRRRHTKTHPTLPKVFET
jgi:hypothetical protein